MRTTVNLDDNLLDRAQALTGVAGRSALLSEALKALIQRESTRRITRSGGNETQEEIRDRRRERRQ
jgi:metal-responsive CopG/Arc/MetJ family transcriptional regulator